MMKTYSFRFSSWMIVGGVLLLALGIFRTVSTSTQAAPKDDIIVLGEVIPTLPAPQIPDNKSPEEKHTLLPDTTQPVIGEEKVGSGSNQNPEVDQSGKDESSFQIAKTRPDQFDDGTSTIPNRILIPSIGLDAEIIAAKLLKVKVNGFLFDQWAAPERFAAGWHTTSAKLGEIGNTVLNGHHNDFGEVFRRLVDLKSGDTIILFAGQGSFSYVVTNVMIMQEVEVPVEQRMNNSKWIAPSTDERLTLVTCWPYESNTHRLVIVAKPSR